MKKNIYTPIFVALFAITSASCSTNAKTAKTDTAKTITEKSTEIEQVGYSFGYAMGEGNREMINDLDVDAFMAGFKDAYAKKDSALTQEKMQEVLLAYKKRREAEYMEELKAKAAENDKKGKDYLVANAKKDGVKVTQSGLQYKVIKAGAGKSPKASDKVRVHYEGRLMDGTVFDSSKKRKQPAEFALNQVIPGWTEGLQLMKEGAEYQFYIPAALAYGETGTQGIPPNSTLIFDVELLKINP